MIKAITIDDEPGALEVIEHHASKIDQLHLVASFTKPLAALEVIRNEIPDLLFLDIQMPDLTGLEFLGLLPVPIPTVLVTAYEDYALESYKYLCIDYLLKPVSFSRFVASVEKYKSLQHPVSAETADIENQKIRFQSGRETLFVAMEEIIYVEADGNYCHIHCTNRKLLIPESLRNLEKRLLYPFIRIHRSFLINLQNIDRVESHQIYADGNRIPVGRKYRDDFRKLIKG